jgi:phosphoserine phosphatase
MIVISDMMGTLTTGSPVLGLVDWVRHNQGRAQAEWHTARMMPGYLLTRLGLLDPQPWGQQLVVDSLGWVKGATPEKFELVAEWAVEHNLWRKRREDVLARLASHAAEGAQVFIATSVVEPIARAFARRIGAEAIATPLSFENGRACLPTGLVASQRKVQGVMERLGVSRVDYAYGDTAMDIPLLESADHPVAVYPDQRLYITAIERGWQVLGEMQ